MLSHQRCVLTGGVGRHRAEHQLGRDRHRRGGAQTPGRHGVEEVVATRTTRVQFTRDTHRIRTSPDGYISSRSCAKLAIERREFGIIF